jgi:hypothetical protein
LKAADWSIKARKLFQLLVLLHPIFIPGQVVYYLSRVNVCMLPDNLES